MLLGAPLKIIKDGFSILLPFLFLWVFFSLYNMMICSFLYLINFSFSEIAYSILFFYLFMYYYSSSPFLLKFNSIRLFYFLMTLAATSTLIASYTLLLIFLSSFWADAKFWTNILEISLYSIFLFFSKRILSLRAMNFKPFTSYYPFYYFA